MTVSALDIPTEAQLSRSPLNLTFHVLSSGFFTAVWLIACYNSISNAADDSNAALARIGFVALALLWLWLAFVCLRNLITRMPLAKVNDVGIELRHIGGRPWHIPWARLQCVSGWSENLEVPEDQISVHFTELGHEKSVRLRLDPRKKAEAQAFWAALRHYRPDFQQPGSGKV